MRFVVVAALLLSACESIVGEVHDAGTYDAGVDTPACLSLDGHCSTRGPAGATCAVVGGYEFHDPTVCGSGATCCVAPDDAGALVPALSGYGVCGDVLCEAGRECLVGIDTYICSVPPDGGAPMGETCGLIHCAANYFSDGGVICPCLDAVHSHCQC